MRGLIIFMAAMAALCLAFPVAAHEGDYTAISVERAVGGLEMTGGNYELTDFGWHRGWDAKPWMDDQLNFRPGGSWDYHISYFAGFINEPDFNMEFQVAAGLRIGYPINERLMPYVIGATGPLLTTQNLLEQGTDLNWGSYAGLGLEYMFDDSNSISLQTTVRHFSNASLHDPNSGVDTNSITLVYRWYDDD